MNLYFRLLMVLVRTRRTARTSLREVVTTRFRVRPTDLDINRHVTNSRYFAFADLGRADLMLRTGLWKAIRRLGWYVVIAEQSITYRRSLMPRQRFEVRTALAGADEKAFYITQDFVVAGTVCATAVVKARFLRNSGGKVPIAEVIEAIDGFPAGRYHPTG